MILQEGQVVRGTYEVERLLGEGAFAEVYRVKHRFLGRQAMKVFKLVGMTVQEIEQSLAEAVLLSSMQHPNIIRVFDANTTDVGSATHGFFTMEYVAGGSLDQFWQSHGAQFVPTETVVEIMRQVCRGLAVAHGSNPPIVHRDIKPQNILVGYDPAGLRVRISDFGLAKHVNPLTLLASAKGTRAFKAPEVFRNPQADSCAGDIWAVGTTFYLLLTDRLPYPEVGDLERFNPKSFERPIIPCSQLNPHVDPALEHIVLRTLAPQLEVRYPNAKELLADLEKWKPRPPGKGTPTGTMSSDTSKNALGEHSPAHESEAQQMVEQAMRLARQAGKPMEAADLMEEAFNKQPGLREKYEYQLKLWRRGIIM